MGSAESCICLLSGLKASEKRSRCCPLLTNLQDNHNVFNQSRKIPGLILRAFCEQNPLDFFAGRWKNFAENIPVHVLNVAAGGTVTTAGQVNLPLDNTGLVPDEARVKRNRYGSKMSYMEVVSKCADTLLTSTLRRIVGHS
jgi:hypothetical protein